MQDKTGTCSRADRTRPRLLGRLPSLSPLTLLADRGVGAQGWGAVGEKGFESVGWWLVGFDGWFAGRQADRGMLLRHSRALHSNGSVTPRCRSSLPSSPPDGGLEMSGMLLWLSASQPRVCASGEETAFPCCGVLRLETKHAQLSRNNARHSDETDAHISANLL